MVGKLVSVSPSGSNSCHHFQDQTITGILIAADPITTSVVLATKSAQKELFVKVLPFVSNIEREESEPEEDLSELANCLISKIKNSHEGVDSQLLASRKASVKKWLESNHLQVAEESEDLVIQGCVRLCPPYSHHDCIATNEIILSRVVELISSQRCSE